MSLLNRPKYQMERDKLIYDASHPIDARVVNLPISAETDGTIARGQLLDFKESAYAIHVTGGSASAIVAEATDYEQEDTDIPVPVYITGCFRASEIVTDADLTASDIEALRGKGIILK